APAAAAASGPAGPGPLGKREDEVARLVADGLTNREIGARLFISERTVDSHIRSILNKLGFSSRAQIAAWITSPGRQRRPRPTPAESFRDGPASVRDGWSRRGGPELALEDLPGCSLGQLLDDLDRLRQLVRGDLPLQMPAQILGRRLLPGAERHGR